MEIEAVVEFCSGVGTSDGTKQGVAYTTYLLAQRPDRVAVCGLYISQHHVSLILMHAANEYYTMLRWNDESARKLLFRVLYYINYPPESMVDPPVTFDNDTFTMKIENEDYKGYTLKPLSTPYRA